jgi:hypothetical protein
MSYWIAKASSPEAQQRFLLVDKASQRHKFDNRLKDDPLINISRIRADIQDLVLERIPDIKNDTKVAKKAFIIARAIDSANALFFSEPRHRGQQAFMWRSYGPCLEMYGYVHFVNKRSP